MRNFVRPLFGVALGAGIVLGVTAIGNLVESVQPPEQWLALTNLVAEDTVLGEAPVVVASREVRREVMATTRVTLLREDARGVFVRVCSRETKQHLTEQIALPDRATLNYWNEVPPNDPCLPVEPGLHKILVWIDVEGLDGERTAPIALSSNEFTVTAPDEGALAETKVQP